MTSAIARSVASASWRRAALRKASNGPRCRSSAYGSKAARARPADNLGSSHSNAAVLGYLSGPHGHGTTASTSAAATTPPRLRHGSAVAPSAYPWNPTTDATAAKTATGRAQGNHIRGRMARPAAAQLSPTRTGQRRV
jgi:hypothetical protein